MADVNVVADSTAQPPYVEIVLTAVAGSVFTDITIVRVQDGVQTLIRNQPTTGTSTAIAYDYEMKYGVPVHYAITSSSKSISSGTPDADSQLTSETVTVTPQYGWLVHPANPAKSMQLPRGRIIGFTDIGRAANATRHDVMGASLPVYTINGSRHGLEFTLELKTRSFDEEGMLWALLNDQIPILIDWLDADAQRLNVAPMFVQVGDVTQARFVQQVYADSDESYPDHWRTWQLPCVQVQSPAISQQTAVWTYLGLLNEQSS
ncbi:hypothetical protein, partial [Bifidobacterium aquikefiri]